MSELSESFLNEMRKFLSIILFTGLFGLSLQAVEPEGVAPDSASILTHLNSAQSTIKVTQPRTMDHRVSYGSRIAVDTDRSSGSGKIVKTGGFRVQIFSDNNVRTAKSNAEYRKRSVEQRMPGTRAYLKYESPYWRVQVGDYRTRAEAENALSELRSAFPAYASDLKIVNERVNIIQ